MGSQITTNINIILAGEEGHHVPVWGKGKGCSCQEENEARAVLSFRR